MHYPRHRHTSIFLFIGFFLAAIAVAVAFGAPILAAPPTAFAADASAAGAASSNAAGTSAGAAGTSSNAAGTSSQTPTSDVALVSKAPISDTRVPKSILEAQKAKEEAARKMAEEAAAKRAQAEKEAEEQRRAAAEAAEAQRKAEEEAALAALQAEAALLDVPALAAIMDSEEDAALLAQGAGAHADRLWIAQNASAYALYGSFNQSKVLRLAAKEQGAVAFVRNLEAAYPADRAEADTEEGNRDRSSGIADDTKVPHLYQWDTRWGYTVYSSAPFGLSGCGPTSFAMVYQGLTGKTDRSPYDMGVLAQDLGCMDEEAGTPTYFFAAAADATGLTCEELAVDAESLQAAFGAGKVVVANVGHGHFSSGDGHYLVLTGFDKNGKLQMNDPYSAANSQQVWDADFVLGEAMSLFAFAAA